jgi:hypothetical protein
MKSQNLDFIKSVGIAAFIGFILSLRLFPVIESLLKQEGLNAGQQLIGVAIVYMFVIVVFALGSFLAWYHLMRDRRERANRPKPIDFSN